MPASRAAGSASTSPQAIVVLSLTCILASAQTPGASISEVISLQQIEIEEFEPAIGQQIRLAYEEAHNKPRDPEAAGKLGMIFQCYGKYEQAGICFRNAHQLAPRSFRWRYYLGNIEGFLGKNGEAIKDITEALQIDKSYAPAHVRLGQLLFEVADFHASTKAYEESLKQNPRLATAYAGLGHVRAAREDWSAAIESYRRACDISPNYAAAHYALGMAYRKTGDMAKAREQVQLYERSKELSQPAEDSLMNEVKSLYAGGLSHFAKGSSLAQQGRTKEAIAEFESALRVNPKLVMAHVNLIAMYGGLGRSDQAEQHFRAAIELDPGWAQAYFNWGLLLARQGENAAAGEAFRKALEVNPYYAEAHTELGVLMDAAGELSEAQRHFRLALENNPELRQAHYLLGRSLIQTGPLAEAIAQLLETIKQEDEKTPVCMQALAVAYQRAGDLDKAVYYFQQARQRAVLRKMVELAAQLQKELDQVGGRKAP